MHASTGSASGDAHGARPVNALAGETSPYLLQHAHNPVDWSPWGPAALARAREQDRPIFLSIGYSACHWCHVMERESFENPQVAAVLNAHFVPIKVDREERPDLDDVYMKATQALSGHGGWPMSVWLTPELDPFYAGTYFPLLARWGQPGFLDVLGNLARAWESQRERVREQGRRVTGHVRQLSLAGDLLPLPQPGAPVPGLDAVDAAAAQLLGSWDREHGGFGSAPKFPHADDIRLLLAQHVAAGDPVCLAAAVHTLDAMARGGIHDQLGGGFHRYSTDERWWIPHFEKMLYDNALLSPAYLEAWRLTGRADFARVVTGIAEWVLAEMVDPGGAFWSTQDADSEGEEGKFFVWTREEVRALLGAEGYRLAEVAWNLRDEPNFEGQAWALVRARPDAELAAELGLADGEALAAALEPLRAKLHTARSRRVRPATDDKVLVAWNGLMIGALASAAEALQQPRWLEAARRAARYCLTAMRPDGRRLLATSRHGRAHLNATLADYAYLACGLLDLFEADGDPAWAQGALELVQTANAHFADDERAGWYFTSDDHETLIARPRDLFDGALPSSNGVMVEACLRLAELTGDTALSVRAERALGAVEPLLAKSPSAFARMLLAAVRGQRATSVVLTGGEGEDELREALRRRRAAGVPVFRVPAEGVSAELGRRWPLLAGKSAQGGRAAAFVCRRGTCTAPSADATALHAALSD